MTDVRVRVKFPRLTFDVLPGEILPDDTAVVPATPQSRVSLDDVVVPERSIKEALASMPFEGPGDGPSTPQSRNSQQSQPQAKLPDEQQLEDDRLELGSSSSNLASKRPPPLEVDVEHGPPALVPAAVTPWSGSGSSGGPPSPGQTGAKQPPSPGQMGLARPPSPGHGLPRPPSPGLRPDQPPPSGATPTSVTGNITVYPPNSLQQPAGVAVSPAAAPAAAPPASSSQPAEMMMVYPPGAEHPVLYQQVGTPVHTPTSPPSTITPPGSPNVVQSQAAAASGFPVSPAVGFNTRTPSGKPLSVAPPASGAPSSPSDGTRSRPSAPQSPLQGELPEAPPGASPVHQTASGRTWWGSTAFKAVTGPIGSGMSELSGRFRRREGSGMPAGGPSAKPLEGGDGVDLPPSPTGFVDLPRSPSPVSAGSPRSSTLLEKDAAGIVAEFDKEPDFSKPSTPAAPVVQRSPRADRRQILV